MPTCAYSWEEGEERLRDPSQAFDAVVFGTRGSGLPTNLDDLARERGIPLRILLTGYQLSEQEEKELRDRGVTYLSKGRQPDGRNIFEEDFLALFPLKEGTKKGPER